MIRRFHDRIIETRGEFNNASARRALVDWYLSLLIMCKAGHQYNERPRALALLNLPLMQKIKQQKLKQTIRIHDSKHAANIFTKELICSILLL